MELVLPNGSCLVLWEAFFFGVEPATSSTVTNPMTGRSYISMHMIVMKNMILISILTQIETPKNQGQTNAR